MCISTQKVGQTGQSLREFGKSFAKFGKAEAILGQLRKASQILGKEKYVKHGGAKSEQKSTLET